MKILNFITGEIHTVIEETKDKYICLVPDADVHIELDKSDCLQYRETIPGLK